MSETDKLHGKTLDFDIDPPDPIAWRFYPRGRTKKISELDIIRELFDQGMEGDVYATILKVPGGYPAEDDGYVDVYEPETACKILADICHYKLYDSEGREL